MNAKTSAPTQDHPKACVAPVETPYLLTQSSSDDDPRINLDLSAILDTLVLSVSPVDLFRLLQSTRKLHNSGRHCAIRLHWGGKRRKTRSVALESGPIRSAVSTLV